MNGLNQNIILMFIILLLVSCRSQKSVPTDEKQTKQTSAQLHHDGLALGKLGKHKEALAKFDKAIKLIPQDNTAWHRKGIELNASERYIEAIKCFDKAIIINRNDRFAWNHRGVSLRELGEYHEALRSCNEAIRINNKYALAS